MLLIQQGHLVNPATKTSEVCDILIEGETIAHIAPTIEPPVGVTIIDARGKHVFPGFIDLHVHLRDPGLEYKEDIHTGSDAAAKGGFSTVCCMPNTLPVNDSKTVTAYIVNKAKAYGKCRVLPYGSISKGMKGEVLTPMAELLEAGAIGFSDDGKNVDNAEMMKIALEYSSMWNALIAAHTEDPHIGKGGVVHEGFYSSKTGLKGIPDITESLGVARDIELAYYTGTRVHFCHVSAKRSVELIRQAKASGLPVTAEVTPHHLFLNDSAIETYDTNFKMNPPLRSEEDRLACIAGLLDGTLDAIATDHAPHAIGDKEKEFDHAPFGVIGLETALPVTLELVQQGKMALDDLIAALTIKPAAILGRSDLGDLSAGKPADLSLWDLTANDTIDDTFFASKSHNSCFKGRQVVGRNTLTIFGGKPVYES